MDPPMVDCRSLIEFCRAFEKHQLTSASSGSENRISQSRNRRSKLLNPLSHPFCEHSPFAAIDAVILLLVIFAIGVLTVPYFRFIFHEASEILPVAFDLMGDVMYQAPVAYGVGVVLALATVFGLWEVICRQARKCGKPYCRGLRKAVEFDIQLESEECVRHLPKLPAALEEAFGMRPLELGHDHKELEAELKKMAPLNGRTVLIFRAPCGCPLGRMEVWGSKKYRKIKKFTALEDHQFLIAKVELESLPSINGTDTLLYNLYIPSFIQSKTKSVEKEMAESFPLTGLAFCLSIGVSRMLWYIKGQDIPMYLFAPL